MKVLIADPEPERARRAAAVCAARDLTCERADQGALALERAIENPPDLLVCPLDLPIIDGAKLAEILRNNPRTRGVVFLYLVEDALDAPVGMDVRDRIVLAPWHREQLAEQIDAALERGTRLGDDRPEHEIAGSLAQISLADLVQLLQLNKKTGTVHVLPGRPHAAGRLLLRDGEIVDATVPTRDGQPLTGPKALFRLLACRRGRFEFTPDDPGGSARIETPTRELLLEGLSQMDQGRRIRQSLPEVGVRVRSGAETPELPPDEQAIVEEVLEAVHASSSIQEILDRLPFPDGPILRTIQTLLARGVLEPATSSPAPGAPPATAALPPLLAHAQAGRVRDWAAAQRPPVRRRVQVSVVAADRAALKAFVTVARRFPDVRPAGRGEPSVERARPLAEIALGEGLLLSLVGLPAALRFRPIWSLALHGMLGAVVVVTGPESEAEGLVQGVRSAFACGTQPVLTLRLGPRAPGEGESPTVGEAHGAALRAVLARLVP